MRNTVTQMGSTGAMALLLLVGPPTLHRARAAADCWSAGAGQYADDVHDRVSSVLRPLKQATYEAKPLAQVADGDSAWCEGVAGRRVGETITLHIQAGAPFGRLWLVGGTPQTAGREVHLPLTRDGWIRSAGHDGTIRTTRQGLVAQGGAWTNGREVKGRRDGNHLRSRQTFDLRDGGDIRMRFAVDAGGKYLALYPTLFSGVAMRHLSTHNSWAGSVVIPERTWLFAHLHVAPSGDYRLAIARGNFADRGGTVFDQARGRLAQRKGRVEFRFVDNYAGAAANVLIGAAWVTIPPPSAAPAPQAKPKPAPPSRSQPADPFGDLGFPAEGALELRPE